MEKFITPESKAIVENLETRRRAETIEAQLENFRVDDTIVGFEQALSAKNEAELHSAYDQASLKIKGLLGGIIFAVAALGYANKAGEVLEGKAESFEMSQAMKKEINKATGFDAVAEAKKVGRTATLIKADKDTQLSIIHIGQIHKTTPEINFETRVNIIKSQKEVAQLLTAATTPSTRVFVEGYTVGDLQYSEQDKVLAKRIGQTSSLKDLNSQYTKIIQENPYVDIAVINKKAGDKLLSMGFEEVFPLVYKKGKEMISLYETRLFPKDKGYLEKNDASSIITGATKILDLQGLIKVEPAETDEGSSKSKRLAEVLSLKGRQLGALFLSFDPTNIFYQYLEKENLPSISSYSALTIKLISQDAPCKKSVECQKLAKEIVEKDIPAIERAVLDDREDIAVELIAKAAKSGQKVFPLVYGSYHDFAGAVIRWNAKNPNLQFNLITVK